MIDRMSRVITIKHYGLISVTGADRKEFLQNQFTSDINSLGNLSARPFGYCSVKGRLCATGIIININDEGQYLIFIKKTNVDSFINRIARYILRSKVEIKISVKKSIYGIMADNFSERLKESLFNNSEVEFKVAKHYPYEVIGLPDGRFVLICSENSSINDFSKRFKLSVNPASENEWELSNIENGIVNITPAIEDLLLPQSINFQQHGGVSFKKGCYPGQEIIARTHYLGKIKRNLYRANAIENVDIGEAVFDCSSQKQIGLVVALAQRDDKTFALLAVINRSEESVSGFMYGANKKKIILNNLYKVESSK